MNQKTIKLAVMNAVVCMAVLLSAADAQEPLTREQVLAMGERFEEARNTPNFDLLDELYSPDVLVHYTDLPENLKGLDALKEYYGKSHAAFPDFKMSLDEMWLDGNVATWLWSVTGTNTASMGETPPTGKRVQFWGLAVTRFESGKIVEEWAAFNQLSMLSQLGFTLTPPAAKE